MSPADVLSLAIKARGELFRAIEEGRFERVNSIASEYSRGVRLGVANWSADDIDRLKSALKAPLTDALAYARIVRAHQAFSFRRYAVKNLYNSEPAVTKRRGLQVSA